MEINKNIKRFPNDFMSRLTKNELAEVVAICDHLQSLKFRPTMPYVFTEQGVAMLKNMLKIRLIKTTIHYIYTIGGISVYPTFPG